MNDFDRTPQALPQPNSEQPPIKGGEVLAVLNADGIDTRRYESLKAVQQIEWLEVHGGRLNAYERFMRQALAEWWAAQIKECKS